MPRALKKLQRLYVLVDLTLDAQVELDKSQANYFGAVLRKKVGDQFVAFNGRDGAWLAEFVQLSKRNGSFVVREQVQKQTTPYDLWYGFAPLKSARMDYMVQKATEIGVAAMQPIMTQFTQVKNFKLDRAQANIIEAAEQCEILSIPDLHPEIQLNSLLRTWTQSHGNRQLVFADEAAPSGSPLDQLAALKNMPVGVLVGPEGGFSDEEREQLLAQPFVTAISLGPRILRADTAAVAALTAVQSIIGDWR